MNSSSTPYSTDPDNFPKMSGLPLPSEKRKRRNDKKTEIEKEGMTKRQNDKKIERPCREA